MINVLQGLARDNQEQSKEIGLAISLVKFCKKNGIDSKEIGRKKWLFSTSQRGAHASANLYSLIETAKANDIEPYEYMKKILTELPNIKSVKDVENLLPWNCQ